MKRKVFLQALLLFFTILSFAQELEMLNLADSTSSFSIDYEMLRECLDDNPGYGIETPSIIPYSHSQVWHITPKNDTIPNFLIVRFFICRSKKIF